MNQTGRVDKYQGEDYQNLYRYLKMYNLINQLYNSDSISEEQFKKQQSEIIQKYKNVKQHIGGNDYSQFAILYDVEQEYRRIENHNKNKNNKLQSVVINLTAKSIQILDTIGYYRDQDMKVSDLTNHLLQITMMLKNYKNARRNIGKGFMEVIQQINSMYDSIKQLPLMNVLPRSDLHTTEALIVKMRHQLVDHANRDESN